jgi:glyoxylase-like metal-dependent hydrolase (beta-lactamase superfamily II)
MIYKQQYDKVTRFDIARSFFGRGHYWTIAYCIDGLMIDTGCAFCAEELYKEIKEYPIKYVVNTHCHEDHIGANGLLQNRINGLDIYAHPEALPVLPNPKVKQPLQLYRKIMWGKPQSSAAKQLKDNEIISTKNYTFKVIYTPGHSPDHLCLYEPEREWLFSGDLFVGGKDRALRADNDIRQIIYSLKKISELPLKILFPGSARVRKNPIPEIKSKIAYLEELGEKVLGLKKQGLGLNSIIRILFRKPMFIEFFTFGHFSRKHLVKSFLSREKNSGY